MEEVISDTLSHGKFIQTKPDRQSPDFTTQQAVKRPDKVDID